MRTWNILRSLGLDEEFSKVAHFPADGSLGGWHLSAASLRLSYLSTGVGFDYRRSDAPTEGLSFERFELPCSWVFLDI